MTTSVLLLDLDHTLFDPETIPLSVMEPAFGELRKANRRMGAVGDETLEASILELMGSPITLVARKYGWPDPLRDLCLELTASSVLPDVLPLYPDVDAIVRLPQRKILVTTGVPAVQLQKVGALGLRAWIDDVHIDDALAVPRRGKRAVFEDILQADRIDPAEVLVVGDRLESEIAAGTALALRTAHIARNGCSPACPATHCLPDLRGLVDHL